MPFRKYFLSFFLGIALSFLHDFSFYFRSVKISLIITCISFFIIGALFFREKKYLRGYELYFVIPFLLNFLFAGYVNFNWILPMLLVFSLTSFFIAAKAPFNFRGLAVFSPLLLLIIFFEFWAIAQIDIASRSRYMQVELPGKEIFLQYDFSDSINLKDQKGKVIVIDFWFERCGYCFKGFKEFQQLYSTYKDDEDVLVLALNSGTDPFFSFQRAKEKIRKLGYDFPVAYDGEQYFSKNKLANLYPQQVIIDKQGRLRYRVLGYESDSRQAQVRKFISVIESLLRE
jgi:thiol-disulfide isomerase/thioredoxin